MNNYTTLGWQLKRGLLNFSEKICENLSRPILKFVSSMLYGLLKSQSVMLTEIARALEEGITVKKTVERLSRNLKEFSRSSQLVENYMETIKGKVDEETIYCIDPGDLCKEYSRKQEKLGKVWDGSKKKVVNGYKLIEITALTHGSKLPIPEYTELYSAETEYSVETAEILESLKHLDKHFGNGGIRTMDRAMDNVKIYSHCTSKEQQFIVRAKSSRNVIHNGKKLNILDLANKYKGKINLKHSDRHGKQHKLKIWHIPVELPKMPGVELTLVVVHGYDKKEPEPLLLLTNMDARGKEKSRRIVKIYLCRWRIEEYYRFKKTQFGLENIRVLSLNSIKTLNLLLSMLTGWLAVFAAKRGESLLLEHIFMHAKRVYAIPKFTLDALADGIFVVLAKTTTGIDYALKPLPQSQQLSLFEPPRLHYDFV